MKGLFQCPPWARSFWAFSPYLNHMQKFSFLPLKTAAGNSERSSDGCKDGDCNLQNRFPSVYFHNLYFNV